MNFLLGFILFLERCMKKYIKKTEMQEKISDAIKDAATIEQEVSQFKFLKLLKAVVATKTLTSCSTIEAIEGWIGFLIA